MSMQNGGFMKYPSFDSDRSVFRSAEKKYKLYYDISSKRRKLLKKIDLSDVIDFRFIINSLNEGGNPPPGVVLSHCDDVLQFFCLETRPGFYFLPGALRIDEQCELIRESLMNFPQPPNRTNHNAIYGPIYGLFNAASKDKLLLEKDEDSSGNCRWVFNEIPVESLNKNKGKAVQASTLLKKLRWSTLGLQFDWSKRNYDISLPHNPIPERLCKLAKRIAAPAMNNESLFKPEAAIVNYFGSGDTLGGHLDDMEADWSKPIVSISLGCKAIFLLGGKSRDDPPVAMFLRSGDVVLMAGDARECFHGVPRIFTDGDNADVGPVGEYLSGECDMFCREYITSSRININVSSTASSPSDLLNLLPTCRRLNSLAMDPIVLSKASAKCFTPSASDWCYRSQNFIKSCAIAGNPEACYTLGMIRFYCLRDEGGGASLMAKAAMMGSHPQALYSLAVILFNGSGGSKNDKDLRAGVALCARAAAMGHIDAIRELGHCLQDGYGVRQNIGAGRRFLVDANARELSSVVGGAAGEMVKCGSPLLSDYGCNVPEVEPHPASRFMMEWFEIVGGEGDGWRRVCSHAGCGRRETRKHEFRRCSVCGGVTYCSRACQALDWKIRHKDHCIAPLVLVEVADGGIAEAVVAIR